MIISSCPLRISLVGGSTDHPHFLKKYKSGSVISFASSLKAYTIVHRDVIGYNSLYNKYIINYSDKECVNKISDIKNELVRHCFEEMNVNEINCYLTSDVFSTGSGLASSSSYLMSLIKSISHLQGNDLDTHSICQLAKKIEKKFNPLVGEQDFYGGSLGNLKLINFYDEKLPQVEELNDEIFSYFDTYLYYTNVNRESTNILKTIDIDKSLPLLEEVNNLNIAIKNIDLELFSKTINKSWEIKKKLSPFICKGDLESIDMDIISDERVLAHKLCGAGGGGYFIMFTEKNPVNMERDYPGIKKISISKEGIESKEI
jgi:D-glycero-alpha-D-manno-heptose-7-phosphate kinase